MKTSILILFILLGVTIAPTVFAVGYTPIVNLPRIQGAESLSAESYINALYFLAITVAALIAIVKIIFAGVKYMLSGVITDKGSAKKDIQGALFGLLIILSAVLILNTINPNLRFLNIFGDAPGLTFATSTPPTTAPVKIGDEYSWWCGPLTTVVCGPEYDQGLEDFTNSCQHDAHGTVQVTYLIGYKCVSSVEQCITASQCTATETFVPQTNSCGQCIASETVTGDPSIYATIFKYETVVPDSNGNYTIKTDVAGRLDGLELMNRFQAGCVNAGRSGQTQVTQSGDNTIYSCAL